MINNVHKLNKGHYVIIIENVHLNKEDSIHDQ